MKQENEIVGLVYAARVTVTGQIQINPDIILTVNKKKKVFSGRYGSII